MRFPIKSVACLVLLVCAPAPSRGQDARVAKAGEERKVVVYNTTTVPDMQRISEAFRKKYPFLEVESYRSAGERLIQKIITEVRAGRHLADAYIISGLQMWLLRDAGHVVPYLSPEREGVMKAFKDQAGYWSGVYFNLEVIGYNTNLVSQGELPKKWEDLLDPKWKGGKLGMPTTTHHLSRLAAGPWGEKKTTEFVKALAGQQLILGTLGELYSRLQLGEISVAVTLHDGFVNQAKKKGAPIVFAEGIEPVISPSLQVGLLKGARHPNAGYLFAAFLVTPEAQEIWEKYTGQSSAFVSGTSAQKYFQGKKVLYMAQEQAEMVDRLATQYGKILGFN